MDAPAINPAAIGGSVLKEITKDSADEIARVQGRIQSFLEANNVSMMGGWT